MVAAITAAVVVIVGVEQGIILAMVLSIVEHIDHSYHPRDRLLSITQDGRIATTPIATGTQAAPGLAIYRFGAGIYYANASRFTEEILELVEDASPSLRWLAVSMASVSDIDYSGSDTVARLVPELQRNGVTLVLARRRRRRAQAARRLRPDRAHRRGPASSPRSGTPSTPTAGCRPAMGAQLDASVEAAAVEDPAPVQDADGDQHPEGG